MLPPATDQVWQFLKQQPALGGFVLIGGSALALRLGYRLSEDLDFAFPHQRLPRGQLDALTRIAQMAGFVFERNDDEAAIEQFVLAGAELHDYQQDFLVNRAVKVSFFTPDASLAGVLQSPPEPSVRVASLAELFKTKCLVSAVRSKSRDWLDLYLLMRDHGYSIRDYAAAFQEAGSPGQCDIGLSRLCSGIPQKDDEGYAHLLSDAPGLEQMKAFFIAQRNRWEVELAAEAFRKRPAGSSASPT